MNKLQTRNERKIRQNLERDLITLPFLLLTLPHQLHHHPSHANKRKFIIIFNFRILNEIRVNDVTFCYPLM